MTSLAPVIPGSYVLVHSPLTGAGVWGRLPDLLRHQGFPVVVIHVQDDDETPFAHRYVTSTVAQIVATGSRAPVVLVAHSGAGPLLPPIGASLRDPLGGYVFLDAGLPWPGQPSRLDLLRREGGSFADTFLESLHAGARFPTWTVDDLADIVADVNDRRALVTSLRPRGLDFFTERLPPVDEWPDAACGYLRTSGAYDFWALTAEQRGWPVVRRELGHFPALADPEATLAALLELIARM
jgi:hypothetical protein